MKLYEVRILWAHDPYADAALAWLDSKKWRSGRDWEIDMHGGRELYTSFWFKDLDKSLFMKLTIGGA